PPGSNRGLLSFNQPRCLLRQEDTVFSCQRTALRVRRGDRIRTCKPTVLETVAQPVELHPYVAVRKNRPYPCAGRAASGALSAGRPLPPPRPLEAREQRAVELGQLLPGFARGPRRHRPGLSVVGVSFAYMENDTAPAPGGQRINCVRSSRGGRRVHGEA